MGYKKHVIENEWLYDLSYGCYESWIETAIDHSDNIYDESFVWPEQRLRARNNALCTEDAKLLSKELIRLYKMLQDVDIVSVISFDWDIVDEFVYHVSYLSKKEKVVLLEILQEIKRNDFPMNENGSLVKVDILRTIHCLKNESFETREHRLLELFRLVIGTERRPMEVCKQKIMMLEELYQLIFGESIPCDEKKGKESREKIEDFIIRILSAIIGESLIDLPLEVIAKKINNSACIQMNNYYFDFFRHLPLEVRERLIFDDECEERAVLLEDNPTYVKYPELKEVVINNMDRIRETETDIVHVFWDDRYSVFVNFCLNHDWFKMSDLLKCNFKELYYSGEEFGISKMTVNKIVSLYRNWIERLCRIDVSGTIQEKDTKINDVLGLFWG